MDVQGRVIVTPKSPIPVKAETLLGLLVNTDRPFRPGVTLTSQGVDYFQYYPEVRVGSRRLILVSPLGSDNESELTSLDSLSLTVYTDKSRDPIRLRIKELVSLDGPASVIDFFQSKNPQFSVGER